MNTKVIIGVIVAIVILVGGWVFYSGGVNFNDAGEGGLSGKVLLGPLCPVKSAPPLSECDVKYKGYATTVTVYSVNSSQAFATGFSDDTGYFSFSLIPPGDYTVSAKPGATLPHCDPVDVSVKVTRGFSSYFEVYCDPGVAFKPGTHPQ